MPNLVVAALRESGVLQTTLVAVIFGSLEGLLASAVLYPDDRTHRLHTHTFLLPRSGFSRLIRLHTWDTFAGTLSSDGATLPGGIGIGLKHAHRPKSSALLVGLSILGRLTHTTRRLLGSVSCTHGSLTRHESRRITNARAPGVSE